VRIDSKGPVFFRQVRVGRDGRHFRIYKFRSMVVGAEQQKENLRSLNEVGGGMFKIASDPRVTRVGSFLRRTSLDELPQLFNVLRGEMSLVGPRPLPLRDVERFTCAADMRRFSVRPGLTCLWQISGRSNVGFREWVTLDLKYIDGWSLALDLVILVRTIPVVLRGTGAQ
jgi:lipopolysaccharide/colanic/teichoic acid biosynthesis glycosyltransferase